jgi:hypothetical protein
MNFALTITRWKTMKTLNILIENFSGNVYLDGSSKVMEIIVTSGVIKAEIRDSTDNVIIEKTSRNIGAYNKNNIYRNIKTRETIEDINLKN